MCVVYCSAGGKKYEDRLIGKLAGEHGSGT